MKQQHSKHLPCFTLEKVIICCLATPASTCSAPEQVEDFLQLHQTSKRSHRGLQSYRSRGRRRFFCWFVVRQTHLVFSGGPGGSWEFTCYIFLQVATRGRGLTRTFFSAEKMDHSAATRFPFFSNFLIYPETGKARMRRLITVYLYSYISKIYLFSVKLYGWCDIFTFTVGCHTHVTRDVCCTRKWSRVTHLSFWRHRRNPKGAFHSAYSLFSLNTPWSCEHQSCTHWFPHWRSSLFNQSLTHKTKVLIYLLSRWVSISP